MFQLSLTSYGQSQISSTVYIDGVALVAAHIDNISSLENLSSLTTVFDDESAGNFNGSSVNIRINDLSSSAYQACTILLYQGSGNNKKVVAGYSHSSAIVSKTAAQELNLFLSFDASCFTNGCMLSSIQVTPATASLNADGIVHIENESTSADDTYSVYSKAQIDSILESSVQTVNNATLTIQKNGSTVNTFTANASSDVTVNITVPTTVASLSDASNYVTTNTTQTITGEKTFDSTITITDDTSITLNYSDEAIPHEEQYAPNDNYARLYTNTRHEMETSGDGSTVPNVVLDLGPYYYTNDSIIESDGSPEFLIMRDDTRVAQFGSYVYLNQLGRYYDAIPQAYITQIGDSSHSSTKIYSDQFIKHNGTSSQFLKADGSVDSNTYLTSSSLSNYVTINTAQTITGEKTFKDVVFHVDNADSDSDLVLDLYHYDDDGTDAESSELTLRPVSDDFGNLGDYTHRYYNIWADNFHGTLHGNASSASTLLNTRYIDGVGFNGSSNIAHYGECSTGASTQIKDVTIPNFNLVTGARVIVKFTYTNSASNPQLRVNTSGTNGTAKPIMYRGTYAITSNVNYYRWQAGSSIEFVYDGTNWTWVGFQEYSYSSYSSTYTSYLSSSGTYVAQGYYSNPTRALVPYNSIATSDLGTASNRWRTLYLSTSISDGTNTYSLPSSTGTLALTSDIPEEIFCEAEVAYSITITSNCDFRLQAPSTSNNPRWRGNGTSLTVTQYVNLTNNLRLSVYVPTKASVASIAFKTTSSSSTYSVYPIYFRGDDSEYNAFIPEGSILRLTFKSNAFYTDFYDLADFGVEHEPIVRVGKVPYNSNDYYNYAGTLVGVRRDNGKFDQLLTVTKSGTVIDDNIIDLADGSPIYVSFQGECFSAHPRVPFGFILNLEYIYSAGQTPNASNVPFRFVTSDGTTIADHIVANTSGEHSYRYFHIDNAPVYLLNYQSRSFNIGGGTDDHLISIGGIPSNVGSMITGRLIGYLCEGAENAGLMRLVQSTSNDNVTLHTNQYITGSKTFLTSQSFLSDVNLGSYTKLSTGTGGTSIYKTFNTILSTSYNDLEKFNITTTTALRNLSSSGYPLSSVRTLPSVNNVWSIGNEYYRLNSITLDKIALCEDSSLYSTFVVEPDLITLIERDTEIGDVTNAKISFKTLNYYGHSPSNTDGIPTGRVEFSFSAIRSDDSSNVATNSFYIDLDSIYPSVNESMSLGNFDNHWKYVYADTINVDSNIYINGYSLNNVIASTTVNNATNAINTTNLRYSTTNVLSATSTSQVTARANIIPNTNSTSTTTGYSLGSSDYKWRNIYGNTIYGAHVIPSGFASLSGSTWTVSSPLTPDVTYSGTPPMGTTIIVYFGSTNTASNPQLKFGSWNARPLYRSSGTYAGTTVATSWPAGSFLLLRYNTNDDVWYLCNGNSYPTSTASGTTNIIPSADLTYDLGSSGYRWDDIFVNYVGSSSSKVSYGYFNYCSISTLRDGSNNNLATLSSAGIIPTTDSTSTSTGVNLGSPLYRWRNIYAAGYPASSTTPSIKIGIDDDVDDAYKMFVGPTTNNAGQLGSSSRYWFRTYSTNIFGTSIYGKLVSLYGTSSGALYVFKLTFNNTSGSSVTLSRGQNLGSLPSGVTITAYQERMDDTGSAGTSYSAAISGTYYTCMQIVLSTGTSNVYVPCIRG